MLNTDLVTKRVAVGAFGTIPICCRGFFQADADFEVKSAVASYFWDVFKTLLGQNVGRNVFFLGVR